MKPKQLSLFDDYTGEPKPKKEILYTSALNENGNVVLINDAEKGRTYYCPKCNNDFILRKSGNTGPRSKRPHFAHKNLTRNCTPEGVLHHSFKKLLVDLLKSYKSENKPLIMNWKCDSCSADYPEKDLTSNLLVKTDRIIEEYNLKVCRPDIALLDTDGEVIAAIEIVVTHAPEENVLRYYKENGITLIQINLFSEDDLHKIQEKIINPDIVNLCLRTNCSNYKNHVAKKKLMISEKKCERCSHPMRVCKVAIDSVFGNIMGSKLTNRDLETAELNGVIFKKDTKNRHLSFVCKTCEKNEEQAKQYFRSIMERKKIEKEKREELRRLFYKRRTRNKFRF